MRTSRVIRGCKRQESLRWSVFEVVPMAQTSDAAFFNYVVFDALRRRCYCFTIILVAGNCKAVNDLFVSVIIAFCSYLHVSTCWQPTRLMDLAVCGYIKGIYSLFFFEQGWTSRDGS